MGVQFHLFHLIHWVSDLDCIDVHYYTGFTIIYCMVVHATLY